MGDKIGDNRFYYFAFGSNLLQERIRLRNESAKYIGVGHLPNYRLNFSNVSKVWGGSTANIIPCTGEEVYGTVWTLDKSEMSSLDKQEGVPKLYLPENIDIKLVDTDQNVQCRVYVQNSFPDGKPSPHYLDIILRGAIQSKLPRHYFEKLNLIQHNNSHNQPCSIYEDIMEKLGDKDRHHAQVHCLKLK